MHIEVPVVHKKILTHGGPRRIELYDKLASEASDNADTCNICQGPIQDFFRKGKWAMHLLSFATSIFLQISPKKCLKGSVQSRGDICINPCMCKCILYSTVSYNYLECPSGKRTHL